MTAARAPKPVNETILAHAPGSPERALVDAELERQAKAPLGLPLIIGGERIWGKEAQSFSAPHQHSLELGRFSLAEPAHVARAISAALAQKSAWAALDQSERGAIFRRAADLLSGPWRARLLAATMLNQSKTIHQAEIDAACELADFFRFNAFFAEELADQPLISSATEHNRFELRPLDGFVYAVTPFNFTAIAGNLPAAPALLGNTVLWKPSPLAALSAHYVLELLEEAGLPPGVINLVHGDPAAISAQALAHPDLSGLHFTGSSAVFRGLWGAIGERIGHYRSYPRVVGETGGKDFIVAHPSADVKALAVAMVRGAFEFQGQKCSAASRVYVPKSIWNGVRDRAVAMISDIKMGDPADFRNFMGAVIDKRAFDKISEYIEHGRGNAKILSGGKTDGSKGYFIQPTLIETADPGYKLLCEEIFGPVLTAHVYDDAKWEETLKI